MSAVTFKKVTKYYKNAMVLDQCDFSIMKNEFVSILGPSGCGKTTTLRLVAGLEMNSSGEISIDDQLVSDPHKNIFIKPEQRHLGMVFQSYAIWPHLSVFDNISFPLKMSKLDRETIMTKVNEILEIVELKGLESRMPQTLSGGQQQRVALARGLVARPRVLLLDEPLSNLDAKLREKMRNDIRKIQQYFKITCIYVTHDQVEAFNMSDRIMLMEKGKILQFDTPDEIRKNPISEFVADFIR